VATKPGRNDACHCGSGKKYKKCCLPGDEASRKPSMPPAASVAPPPAGPPAEPGDTASSPPGSWWTRWSEQVAAARDTDTLLDLARRALAEAAPADDSLTEAFDPLLVRLQRAGRHTECVALLGQIEQRFPGAFRPAPLALLRFESALQLRGADRVREARRLGPHLVELLDLVDDLPARLAWEGHLSVLRALAESSWPALREGDPAVGEAIARWAAHGLGAVLLEHLDRTPDLSPDDPALEVDLALYEVGLEPGRVAALVRGWLRLLQPGASPPATPGTLARLGQKYGLRAARQLTGLIAEVAARLQARGGWSRAQAWVLLQELGPLLQGCARRAPETQHLQGILLPAAPQLLAQLDQQSTRPFGYREHAAAAVVLALPAWAGLVVERGWVSEPAAREWQQQVMEASRTRWLAFPGDERSPIARRLLIFTEGAGRSREAWL
jgi:hypothetical protein